MATWVLNNKVEIEKLINEVDEHFKIEHELDILKQNSSYYQFIQQGEVDVIGVNICGKSIEGIYAIDVAFHEAGLNYGSKFETASRVIKKMVRTVMLINGYFDLKEREIIFASPKINNATMEMLYSCIKDLEDLMSNYNYNFHFKLLANDDFREEVFLPVLSCADTISDTSELFMRSIQMINIFEKNLYEKSNIKDKSNIERINKEKDEIIDAQDDLFKDDFIIEFDRDEKEFKVELINRKIAYITEYYSDGTTKIIKWNASKFKESSNLRGNISSKTNYRMKVRQRLGIKKIFISINKPNQVS